MTRNWGKGRSKAAAKRRKKREATAYMLRRVYDWGQYNEPSLLAVPAWWKQSHGAETLAAGRALRVDPYDIQHHAPWRKH